MNKTSGKLAAGVRKVKTSDRTPAADKPAAAATRAAAPNAAAPAPAVQAPAVPVPPAAASHPERIWPD